MDSVRTSSCCAPEGLYCPPGEFYVDPRRPVPRAVITHAHADPAPPGHAHYLAATPGASVLRARLGAIDLQTLDYGERVDRFGGRVSLHPAGHVLDSTQARLEHRGRVWVVSGDYFVAGHVDGSREHGVEGSTRQRPFRLHLRGLEPRAARRGRARCAAGPRRLADVAFAKAYAGLTDEEFRRVDRVVRVSTLEKFRPVDSVRPSPVFELGFEGINRSPRHKSDIAVYFLRIRDDKPLHEADTLQALEALPA